jgi:hypothetical protein
MGAAHPQGTAPDGGFVSFAAVYQVSLALLAGSVASFATKSCKQVSKPI